VDVMSRLVDRVVDVTGPYGAMVLLAAVIILSLYYLLGR
jgi:hypothetical protein